MVSENFKCDIRWPLLLILLLVALFQIGFTAETFSQTNLCQNYLFNNVHNAPFSKEYILENNLKPHLGLYVQLESGEKVFAIGKFFSGSHMYMFSELQTRHRNRIRTVLWGGEILGKFLNQKFVIYSANETSGFVHNVGELRNRLDFGPETMEVRNFMKLHSTMFEKVRFLQSRMKSLESLRQSTDTIFHKDYIPLAFSEDSRHIIPGVETMSLNMRHEFRTRSTNLLGAIGLLASGRLPSLEASVLREILDEVEAIINVWLTYDADFFSSDDQAKLRRIAILKSQIKNMINVEGLKLDFNWKETYKLYDWILREKFFNHEKKVIVEFKLRF